MRNATKHDRRQSADEFVEHTTVAALEEKAKLQKHFGRFDIFFFLICTLVGLDTLGAVSNDGAQAFTWLAFLGIVFFVPYALLTAELGSTFTEEGGAYIWVKLAFGRFMAAINSVLYWLSNPIWLGGTLTILAVTTFSEFFTPLNGVWQVPLLRSPSSGSPCGRRSSPSASASGSRRSAPGSRIVVARRLHADGDHLRRQPRRPRRRRRRLQADAGAIFIAAVPVLFFNYVGFELPNAAGDEMKNPQKDVPFTVIRAAIGTFVLYGVPILAILLVLPAAQITSLGGFIDAMKTVFTVYGGHIATAKDGTVTATLTGAGKVLGDLAAIGFISALLSSGTTWIMGADRVAGRGRLRRRRAALVRRLLQALGHADRRQRALGRLLDDRHGAGLRAHQGNAGKYFTRRARPRDLDHDDLLPASSSRR